MPLAIPNWIAGFLIQTRSFPDIVSVVNNRITAGVFRTYSPQDPSGWNMPNAAIVYRSIAGPSRREFQAPIRWQTIQVECYGKDLRLADDLYRRLWPHFMPQDMTLAHGFVVPSLGVAVMAIEELGSQFVEPDPVTGWPRSIVTWWVQMSEQPNNIVYSNADIGSSTGTNENLPVLAGANIGSTAGTGPTNIVTGAADIGSSTGTGP
jgi:hypothetical protein